MPFHRQHSAFFLVYALTLSACADAPGAHQLLPATDTQFRGEGDLVNDMIDLQGDSSVEQLDDTDSHSQPQADLSSDVTHDNADLPTTGWQIELINKLEQDIGGLALAADSEGTLHVSYATSSDRELVYASNASDEWTIENAGQSWCCTEDNTTLAVDTQDRVHLFYGASGIYHAFRRDDLSWESELLQAYTGNNNYAMSATTYNDDVHLAYRFYNLVHLVYSDDLWTSQLVDDQSLTGEANSIKVDNDGYFHISYTPLSVFSRNAEGELVFEDSMLRYATNVTGELTHEIIDETGRPSYSTSLALENGNTPHIAYYAAGDGALRYAVKDSEEWSITTIDNNDNAGFEASLALSPGGQRHVAYQAVDSETLMYAHWNGAWDIESIDYWGSGGNLIEMSLSPSGIVHIVYFDRENLELRHAYK